jgi:chloramphenicol 3-O phosphotransferase
LAVPAEVIVLNGGSSAGKSTLAVGLQRRLAGTWLTLGVDDLIRAMSYGPSDTEVGGSIEFRPDGSLVISDRYRRAEASWYQGLAAIVRAGTGVIVDEVFLDGGTSQARLRPALAGLPVLWVGVQCHPDVAEAREIQRGDRNRGMARNQADRVHQGVTYDIVVDTTDTLLEECVEVIVAEAGG